MAPGSQRKSMRWPFPQVPPLPSTLSNSGERKWPVGDWKGPFRAGGCSLWSKGPHAEQCSNGYKPLFSFNPCSNKTSVWLINTFLGCFFFFLFIHRLLKAGRAEVYHCPPPSYASITHVMAKPVTESSKSHSAPCYPVSHIVQHLFGVSHKNACFKNI